MAHFAIVNGHAVTRAGRGPETIGIPSDLSPGGSEQIEGEEIIGQRHIRATAAKYALLPSTTPVVYCRGAMRKAQTMNDTKDNSQTHLERLQETARVLARILACPSETH